MMCKKRLTFFFGLAVVLFLAGLSYGQVLPQPGEIIDKSNIAKYAHLFPKAFLPIFQDGFGGVMQPIRIKAAAARPSHISETFLKLSEKNKGKYKIEADGNIRNLDRNGWPFPDLDKNDKDFATKVMWNFDNNYLWDEYYGHGYSLEKRKGEMARVAETVIQAVYYRGRICVPPKPELSNPLGLYYSIYMSFVAPESMKDSAMLIYRFVDTSKKDTNFVYLPAMRRILRADSGQRATPMGGSMIAPDDTNGFGGRTPEFTYKLIGEQKVLAVAEGDIDKTKDLAKRGELAVPTEDWQPKDVYVIEITAKDPKYPQSKKVVYMDKTTLVCYYAVAWDRAGKPWKVFAQFFKTVHPLPNENHNYLGSQIAVDVQFGLVNFLWLGNTGNKSNFRYDHFTPSAVLSKAK